MAGPFLLLPTALLAHWPPCGRAEEEINVGGKSGNTRRKAVVGREEEKDKYCTRGRVGTLGGRLQYEYSTYNCSREGGRRDQCRREEWEH